MYATSASIMDAFGAPQCGQMAIVPMLGGLNSLVVARFFTSTSRAFIPFLGQQCGLFGWASGGRRILGDAAHCLKPEDSGENPGFSCFLQRCLFKETELLLGGRSWFYGALALRSST